jgi:hypothetical protein
MKTLDGVTGGRQTLAITMAVPESDGVIEPDLGVGACSKHHRRDDHGPLCRNRRIAGKLEPLRCGRHRACRTRSQDRQSIFRVTGNIRRVGRSWHTPPWCEAVNEVSKGVPQPLKGSELLGT